jgi:hypothetical protein
VEHRVAAGRILKRRVGVPETIAQAVRAAAVTLLEDLAVGPDVGDVPERLVAEAVLLDRRRPELRVQGAVEPLCERQMLVVGEALIVKHENGVLIHGRADGGQRRLVVHGAQLDGAGLADEHGMQLREGQGHGAELTTGHHASANCAHSAGRRASAAADSGPLAIDAAAYSRCSRLE